MTSDIDTIIQKTISPFIEKQFPQFYRDEGPVFVAFLKTYVEWLESQTTVASANVAGSYVSIASQSANVKGTGTQFTDLFSNGDQIAVWSTNASYSIFTINSVANNTLLTISGDLPTFSNTKSNYATVKLARNPIYDARRYLEYQDIDATLDEYIVHFKNKLLNGIQFTSSTSIRQLLKHALDLYRAKGTEQAIQLLFRIIFGTNVNIYYPGSDLFKLSDGEWFVPRYIEISLNDHVNDLVEQEIVGVSSGATAFVDRAVRRNVDGLLSDILYVSSITGTFATGELIDLAGEAKLDPDKRPLIVGSLTSIDIAVTGSGIDFKIGDIVTVESDTGHEATARVTGTANNAGIVTFDLIDGGYGYEVGGNTAIIISNNIVILSNTKVDDVLNPWVNNYTQLFETLVQPMGDYNYISANGSFNALDTVYTYYANGTLQGTGTVLYANTSNSTAGVLRLSVLSGNLNSNQIFKNSNAVVANLNPIGAYVDKTATGNCMGQTANVIIKAVNAAFIPSEGDVVYQFDSVGAVSTQAKIILTIQDGSNVVVTVVDDGGPGPFRLGRSMYANGGVTLIGNVVDIQTSVGLIGLSNNALLSTPGNFVYTVGSNTTASILSISQGSGASINFQSLTFTENASIVSDKIAPYLNINIGGTTYGFPALPTANVNSSIGSSLSNVVVTIGRIAELTNYNPGSNYTASPLVFFLDEQIASYDKHDFVLQIDAPTSFNVGEEITQADTGARGLVKSTSNTTVLNLTRLTFSAANSFSLTSNVTTQIVGSVTGLVANVVNIDTDRVTSQAIGSDAVINPELAVSNGSIIGVKVLTSGYGFTSGQSVTMTSDDGHVATGFSNCQTIGTGQGFYRQKGGFLSDQKKLYDGFYWQYFSYDVRSPISLDKYAEMLRQVAHVAGTKNFATMVTVSESDVSSTFQKSLVSLS